MSDTKVQFISYSKDHIRIVEEGIEAIKEVLLGSGLEAKLSILFCLDRYYDSYYGYKLECIDELTNVLQDLLFTESNPDVIEEIFSLLSYNKGNLDILAHKIEAIDKRFLAQAIETLGMDYNDEYEHIFIEFSESPDKEVKYAAKEGLMNLEEIRVLKSNRNY